MMQSNNPKPNEHSMFRIQYRDSHGVVLTKATSSDMEISIDFQIGVPQSSSILAWEFPLKPSSYMRVPSWRAGTPLRTQKSPWPAALPGNCFHRPCPRTPGGCGTSQWMRTGDTPWLRKAPHDQHITALTWRFWWSDETTTISLKKVSKSGCYLHLVGGWATPLKNMKVNWDDYSQIWENKIDVPNHQPVIVLDGVIAASPRSSPTDPQ